MNKPTAQTSTPVNNMYAGSSNSGKGNTKTAAGGKTAGQVSGSPMTGGLQQAGSSGIQIGGKPTYGTQGLQIGGKPTVGAGTDTKIPGQVSGTPMTGGLQQAGGEQNLQIGGKPNPPEAGAQGGAAGGSAAGGGAAGGTPATGNGLSGVSTATQAQLNQYGTYQAGQPVSAAQQQLDAILGEKPGEYSSRYDERIQGLLDDITSGREKFDYSFADDNLFNYYSDLYQQQGRQAAQDVAGQAAALTGGYGNSWGASAAQQAYQQNLNQLYDKGLEFRDRAYEQWQNEQADKYNRLSALQNAENTDYGRYRDLYGDWQNARNYLTDRYDTETNRDYERWLNDRNYWNTVAQQENADYWTGQNFQQNADQFAQQMGYNYANLAQNQAQFDANLAQNQAQFVAQMELNWANHEQNASQFDQQTAAGYVQAILANGQMPSEALLMAAGLSKKDAQKLIAQMEQTAAGGGGSPGTNPGPKDNGDNGTMTLQDYLKLFPKYGNTILTNGKPTQQKPGTKPAV